VAPIGHVRRTIEVELDRHALCDQLSDRFHGKVDAFRPDHSRNHRQLERWQTWIWMLDKYRRLYACSHQVQLNEQPENES
jgi:hypothetical protein